jgi:hypothetical protein
MEYLEYKYRTKIEKLPGEKWKWIKGSKGRYLISNKRRLYSVLKARLLSPIKNSWGFEVFSMFSKKVSIDKLVKDHFQDVEVIKKSVPDKVRNKDKNSSTRVGTEGNKRKKAPDKVHVPTPVQKLEVLSIDAKHALLDKYLKNQKD